jgi:hypothetical protein
MPLKEGVPQAAAAAFPPELLHSVLVSLCRAEGESSQRPLRLRRIATAALGGDEQKAAAVLAELDVLGYVGTRMMGWHFGWVTEKGRRAAAKASECP